MFLLFPYGSIIENRKITPVELYGKDGVYRMFTLNQEAKQQQAYKRGEAIEIGGFVVMLAGAGVAFLGQQKRNELKSASGKTIAILEYGPTPNGVALALKF